MQSKKELTNHDRRLDQLSHCLERSRATVLFMPFGDKKMTQFSGFLYTSVSYLKDLFQHLNLPNGTEKMAI